jgi:uncharacterized membrane protein
MSRRIIAGLLLLAGASLPAQASWKICNKDSETARVAIGYVTSGDVPYASEGWWELKACDCKTVLNSNDTSDPNNVFMLVRNDKGDTVIEGSSNFCISNRQFKIKGKERCTDRGYQLASFERQKVDLNRGHTTNLRPPKGRTATCID